MLARDRYASRQMYDDYDEYEEDDEEHEDEVEHEEEEEEEKPSQEVLDYLKLREKLKERIRQKHKKENAAVAAPSHSTTKSGTTTDTKFGSFFGPSQRVIAPRVIEESKSLKEARHIVSRAPTSSSVGKHVPSNGEVKFRSKENSHKVINEQRKKVETLKERRDYSFLLSDDADLPTHTDERPPRDLLASISDAQAGRSSVPQKMSINSKPTKQVPESHLSRNAISRDQHVKKKVEYQKAIPPGKPKLSSSEPRKLQGEHQKAIPPSRPTAYSSNPTQLQAKNQKAVPPSRPKASFSEPKRILEASSSGGHRQPIVAKASSLNAAHGTVTRKAPVVGGTKPSSMERVHSITKSQSYVQKNFPPQRREIPDTSKGKLVSKQMMSSSKPQLSKPPKQIQQRTTHDDKPKQKSLKRLSGNPFYDDDDDIDDPLSFLRNNLLSKYNSAKYQDYDDDDSDMEANFDDIMKEERRSSRIAKEEDEEQLRLIEEEERRERMRKEAKRRKLQR